MREKRLVVVMADDLTGAAEMAGIAWRHGLRVVFNALSSWVDCTLKEDVDVLIVATDTRSMTNEEAVATVKRMATVLLNSFFSFLFFKKTDSALRGHIVEELSVLMDIFHAPTSLLLPQNPSKGRRVADGIYTIDGVPLNETPFGHDPEFPATSSFVSDILPGCCCLSLSQPLADGICVADASSIDDVRAQLSKACDDTLLAGGADFFDALLSSVFTSCRSRSAMPSLPDLQHGTFVVCGSTFFNLPSSLFTFEMPEDVFHGACADRWINSLALHASNGNSFAIAIGSKPVMGRSYAVRLREIMALAAVEVLHTGLYHTVVMEGGATAFAILHHAHLTSFKVEGELSPGVVALCTTWKEKPLRLILKPGSYAWGTIGQWLL